jgi:hypothetical protein
MLELTDSLIIGKGSERACYIHPEDALLCVKVSHSKLTKQTRKEIKYCELLLRQGKLPCQGLPRYLGTVQTSLGQGTIFERIKNYDGQACLSLHEAFPLLKARQDQTSLKQIIDGLAKLKEQLLGNHILVRDLTLKNIFIQYIDENHLQLILIDGFGNSDFIPIANYLNFYAELKLKRKWQRLENVILTIYPEAEAFLLTRTDSPLLMQTS